jgi:hypothetical protein
MIVASFERTWSTNADVLQYCAAPCNRFRLQSLADQHFRLIFRHRQPVTPLWLPFLATLTPFSPEAKLFSSGNLDLVPRHLQALTKLESFVASVFMLQKNAHESQPGNHPVLLSQIWHNTQALFPLRLIR